MPRPLRVEYAGARYHIMCRGNRNAVVFASDDDVRLFLKTLSQAVQRNDWRVHAYVLMNTHYHLLLETPSPNLVEGMKWFQGTFTQRMNAMHKTWGHLFQGRYKAKVIEEPDPVYFQKVADYIHLNPAAAGLLRPPSRPLLESYVWSSYPAYLQAPARRPDFLSTAMVLDHHGIRDTPAGRKAYRALMQLKALSAVQLKKAFFTSKEWKGMERGWVHGEKEFREKMQDHIQKDGPTPYHSVYDAQQKRDLTETSALAMIHKGCRVLKVSFDQLPELKKSHEAKVILAGLIKANFSIGNLWISKTLHMGHPSLVGHCGSKISGDRRLLKQYKHLTKRVGSSETTYISG